MHLKLEQIKHQMGASLIESMAALFVFSVGALGIAAMQTTSMVRGDDTRQRSIAIWKAQELVDRIKSTKTIYDTDGLIPEFIAEIGNDNSDNGIGVYDPDDVYECPLVADEPVRCDDQFGNVDATACTTDEVVEADIWMVLCEQGSGVIPRGDAVTGSVGLRDLEVSLEQVGAEYRLYFEWLNRATNNNLDVDGVDSGQQNSDGSARTVVTTLCGEEVDVDSRLDAYCLRFQ